MIKHFILLMAVIMLAGCSSDQTVNLAPDPAVATGLNYITLRTIDDNGRAQVEIPLSVFGESEQDLALATFDITVNDYTRNTGLKPQDYYAPSVERVAFFMYGLEDGDAVTFMFLLSAVSNEAETTGDSADETVETDTTTDLSADEATDTADTAEDIVYLVFKGNFSTTEDTAALLESDIVTEDPEDAGNDTSASI